MTVWQVGLGLTIEEAVDRLEHAALDKSFVIKDYRGYPVGVFVTMKDIHGILRTLPPLELFSLWMNSRLELAGSTVPAEPKE